MLSQTSSSPELSPSIIVRVKAQQLKENGNKEQPEIKPGQQPFLTNQR
jgi:hypothetical protein